MNTGFLNVKQVPLPLPFFFSFSVDILPFKKFCGFMLILTEAILISFLRYVVWFSRLV